MNAAPVIALSPRVRAFGDVSSAAKRYAIIVTGAGTYYRRGGTKEFHAPVSLCRSIIEGQFP